MTSGSVCRVMMIGLAVLLSGCGGRGGRIPYDVGNFGPPDAPKLAAVDESYRLAPLDTVTVKVFGVPDLSQDYQVDQSGRLSMPLLDRVDAVGLSTSDLAKLIARRLNEKFLRDPNVTVALKESASRIVTIDGSVKNPGVFSYTNNSLTLMQAVALARGTDDSANPHRVAIFRMIDGKRMAAAFDLTRIRRGDAQDPTIYPGDTIVVDGSGLKKAQRDLLQTVPLVGLFITRL